MKTLKNILLALLIVSCYNCQKDDVEIPDNENFDLVTGETGTFIDSRDNQTYKWVKIGTQTWMAENLNYSDNNGFQVHITDQFTWDTNDSYDAWCYYDNISSSETYGAIYQHNAALNAVPSGWHLPTREEWEQLETYLISNGYSFDDIIGNDGIAKALASRSAWNHSGIYGTIGNDDFLNYDNITGFTALPAGYRTVQGFIDEGFGANWWTATSHNSVETAAYTKRIYTGTTDMHGDLVSKATGLSVRCIKD